MRLQYQARLLGLGLVSLGIEHQTDGLIKDRLQKMERKKEREEGRERERKEEKEGMK